MNASDVEKVHVLDYVGKLRVDGRGSQENPYKSNRAPRQTVPNLRGKELLTSPQILKQLESLDKGGYARSSRTGRKKHEPVLPSDLEDERLQTIFLDDPSFNFDYAHILPKTEKCSVMHGHTSSALVEIMGRPVDGMVVDFNDAKPIIKKAISDLDHKLFINEKYVTGRSSSHVDLAFMTVHGDFSLHVPVETTVLLDGEATVENLARELLTRIAPKMPENVEAVGIYVYEGLNKGPTCWLGYTQGEQRLDGSDSPPIWRDRFGDMPVSGKERWPLAEGPDDKDP